MEISTRDVDGVTVIDISGSLDTQTSGAASDEMARIAQEASKMLLNLESLDFLSSAGLRVLLATAKLLRGSGGEMRVCGLNEVVQEVFEISGFSSLLSVQADRRAAVGSF